MVGVPGGTFRMGDDLAGRPCERPAHEVLVEAFRMDEHEVTNRQFAQFVAQTGYVTTARQRGWSLVFDEQKLEWVRVAGADWRHPAGPHGRIDGREDCPVVHVSWYDAAAYAKWAGKRLPSEAQWEYACRGGLRDAEFPWGDGELIDGRHQANTRQGGRLSGEDSAADGFLTVAPVKSFAANRFGLYDMSGNVWEWCGDWCAEDYYRYGPRENPTGPTSGKMRVARGGSWATGAGFTVSTRSKQPPQTSRQDLGFRCAEKVPPDRY